MPTRILKQFHLSTCIIGMLFASFFLWLNLTARATSEVNRKLGVRNTQYYYGWPWDAGYRIDAEFLKNGRWVEGALRPEDEELVEWISISSIAKNGAVGVFSLIAVLVMCEGMLVVLQPVPTVNKTQNDEEKPQQSE